VGKTCVVKDDAGAGTLSDMACKKRDGPAGVAIDFGRPATRKRTELISIQEHFVNPQSGVSERVAVQFEPQGDATEVIVVHERIPNAAMKDKHQQGWEGCLDGLADYLSREVKT
jgi:uncharacterized protein YndB with AHSA1/START domain